MKAVILAAGIGKRLRPLTNSIPKPLIKIGDKSLLEHSLSNLGRCGIREVIIVAGYLGHMINECIGDEFSGIKITYVENELYDKSGSMYSLWLGAQLFDDGFIFLDGDILYSSSMIDTLINSGYEDAILVSKLNNDTGEEIKVYVEGRSVKRLTKKKVKGEVIGEAVGIVKISKKKRTMLMEKIREQIENKNMHLEHEDAVEMLCALGVMRYVLVEEPWIEIDCIEDLARAREEIYPLIRDQM